MDYIINTLTYLNLYNKNDKNKINDNLYNKHEVIDLSSLNISNNSNNLKVKKESLLLKKSEGYKNTHNSSYLIK